MTLKAWNDMGTDTETKNITVSFTKPLNADFNATPLVASTGDTIRFCDNSDTSPNQWFWEFGDGTNSTLRNPTHAYSTGGNYTINLTAWNANGSDTRTIDNYVWIYPDPKPVAAYTSNYSYSNVVPPLTVAFNDTSAGYITNWSWDFGDGNVSYEKDPVHTFNLLPQTVYRYFLINHTVTDQFGRSASTWEYIFIYKGYNPDFTAEPSESPNPLNVTFTDFTEDPEQALGRYWEFGDGQTQFDWEQPFAESVYHEYLSEGNYSVSLTYYGPMEDGFTITKEFHVPVQGTTTAPLADFSANTTLGKAPLVVAFSDQSTGLPATWSWDFGDGTGSDDQDPVHTYSSAGTYSVSLTAANPAGSNATVKADYIVVLPSYPPAADFSANTTEGKSPLAVAFTDTSANSPVNWTWDFGDGSDSAEKDPVHIYTVPGQYTVSLEVMNDDGSDKKTREDYITVSMELPTMTIVPPDPVLPVADFTATPRSGEAPLDVVFNDTSTGIPTGWSWDFGDGTGSDDQDPVHTYPSAGTYTVSLTATNPFGRNTTTRINYITVSEPAPTPTQTPDSVQATIRIEPETLNLKSKGEFTAFITLPPWYDIHNIDVTSLECEGARATDGHATGEGSDMFIAKFNRQDLVGVPTGDNVTFTVTGTVISNGIETPFSGSDTIRVKD